jgi:opacity protein-like surface antigen
MRVVRGLLPALAALALMSCGAGAARAAIVGVGAYGGSSFPVIQYDREWGAIGGVRVPIGLARFFSAEPYLSFARYGNRVVTINDATLQRDGGRVGAIGLDVLAGAPWREGFHLFPLAGIALHRSDRFGDGTENRVGYNFGLGLGWTFPSRVSLDVRSEMAMIVNRADASRKFGNVTFGLGYHFAGPEP